MSEELLTVTQADRDAAAQYVAESFNNTPKLAKQTRDGKAFPNLSEAFARHREAALAKRPTLTPEVVKEVKETLRPFAEAWTRAMAVADIGPMVDTARRHVDSNDFRNARRLLTLLEGVK